MNGQIDISIILINYKNKKLTEECVKSILNANIKASYEVVVVDNCSKDGSFEFLKNEYVDSEIIQVIETERNGGFAYGNNIGIRNSCGEYLFILNNDTILYPEILDLMLHTIKETPNLGMLGCKAVDKNNKELPTAQKYENYFRLLLQVYIKPITEKMGIQRWLVSTFSSPKEKKKIIYSDWIVGSAMLVSRELYYKVGGLDENYFMYMEDEDLCKRIRQASYKIATLNRVGYVHYCGGSTINSYFLTKEYLKSKLLFFARYEDENYSRTKRTIEKFIKIMNPQLSRNETRKLKEELELFVRKELPEKTMKVKGVVRENK